MSPRDSPITSPSSPLTPISKGADPTLLILNSEPLPVVVNTAHPGLMNEAWRGSSPTKMSRANSIKERKSPRPASTDEEIMAKRSSEKEQALRALGKDEIGRGYDITKDDGSALFMPKLAAINGSMAAQKSRTTSTGYQQQLTTKPSTTAQLPPLHPTQTASGALLTTTSNLSTNGDKRPTATSDDPTTTPAPSIESQVISTQISENSHGSASRSGQMAPLQQSNVGGARPPPKCSSRENLKAATSNARGQRSNLNPLDVKGTGGTVTTNVCVSQHTRKRKTASRLYNL